MDEVDHKTEQLLQDTYRVEPPAALRHNLLAIAEREPRNAQSKDHKLSFAERLSGWLSGRQWRMAIPAMAAAAAFAMIWTAAMRMPDTDLQPPAATAQFTPEQTQTIEDFAIVMSYLQAATAQVNRSVGTEVGAGLMMAYERGEQSFKDNSNRVTNGG